VRVPPVPGSYGMGIASARTHPLIIQVNSNKIKINITGSCSQSDADILSLHSVVSPEGVPITPSRIFVL
jgi:hypothetical protein